MPDIDDLEVHGFVELAVGAQGADPAGDPGESGTAYPSTSAGFKLWTADPSTLTNVYDTGAGVMIMLRVRFPRSETISTLHSIVTTTGAGPAVGDSGMALYSDAGNLLSKSADLLVNFTGGAFGKRDYPLADPQTVTAGDLGWLALLFNGGGGAAQSPSTPANLIDPVVNVGARRSVYLTGQSTFPASVDIAGATLNNGVHWMAAS